VVVVDDSRDAADSLGILLGLWGHEARAAYSGAGALELARDFCPQVVLLNVVSPGMTGWEVAQGRGPQRRPAPFGKCHPKAVEATRELGSARPTPGSKSLADPARQEVGVAVTMGCGDECPHLRAKERIDWQIPDPREMPPEQFCAVRDLIESKVKELLAAL